MRRGRGLPLRRAVPHADIQPLTAAHCLIPSELWGSCSQSGTGKSHACAAIGYALIERGRRVLFTSTAETVQKLQAARRELALPAALDKLDKYHLIVLDDLSYVRKDQAETSVLFELIAHRYERHSLAITANQPFSQWNQTFPDPAMTVAAIDRLVHHATIIEMNGESYRKRSAAVRTNAGAAADN